jgi:putative two-component system response regulator
MKHRELVRKNREYQQKLENMVSERTKELQNTLLRLEEAFVENRKAHLETIIVLSKIAEVNDKYTGNHIKRVSSYCEELSKTIHLPSHFVEQITYSSPMHDIGKIFVDPVILKKQGKLTQEEFQLVRLHTIQGAKILEGVPFLQMAHDIALYHHENYDGTGYPIGLEGEKIPLAARIVTICDVFDALIAKRSYKKPYPLKKVSTIMLKDRGKRFDPEIVEIFLKAQQRMYEIYWELRD